MEGVVGWVESVMGVGVMQGWGCYDGWGEGGGVKGLGGAVFRGWVHCWSNT